MGEQRKALEQTIGAVGVKLRPEHSALLAAARGLADAVDVESERAQTQERAISATLWKQYREAVVAVIELLAEAEGDDGQAALLKLVKPRLEPAKRAPRKAKTG